VAALLLLVPFPAMADTPGTNNIFQLDNTVAGGNPFPGFVFGGQGTGGTDQAYASVSDAASIVPLSGMLDSPYYRSSEAGNPYFGLTYRPPDGVPLSFALGVGTSGSEWHTNDKLVYSQDGNDREVSLGELKGDVNTGTTTPFAITDQTIVAAASVGTGQHHRGPGTLTVEGTIGFTGGPVLGVKHLYTLLAGRNYIEVTTTISNNSGSPVNNVNMWVGTADDWIQETDSPVKVKGRIQGSANTAVFNAACSGATNAIIVSTPIDDDDDFGPLLDRLGAYVMVYSPADGADTVLLNSINSWNTQIVDLDPADSLFDVPAGDGSYALYLPFGNIANGATKSITWYFEGGELTFPAPQNCADVVETAAPAAASGPMLVCTPDPVVPGGTVTCQITGGDPNIDILWRASFNGAFAGAGVRLDEQGRGTFTFVAPRGAAGQSVAVTLVEWTDPVSVGVTANVVPVSLPAGEGSGGVPLLPLLLATLLLVVPALRIRSGAGVQG